MADAVVVSSHTGALGVFVVAAPVLARRCSLQVGHRGHYLSPARDRRHPIVSPRRAPIRDAQSS